MNLPHLNRILLPTLAVGVACTFATAQDPVNPPPWWGVLDDQTVSLSWHFPQSFQGQPDTNPSFSVVPGWYNNPTPWSGTNNLTWLNTLNGHNGVCALVGTGTPNLIADLNLFVDNDPHLDWVKIFWFQVDIFEGSSGQILQQIEEQLSDYGRASVTETVTSLGSGWQQLTVSAKLIPQPDDEEINFKFIEDALGTVAIDNLHISSKCVNPRCDEDGEPLGKVMSGNNVSANSGRQVRSVAVTRSDQTAPKRFWISALGQAGQPHEIIEVTSSGVPIGTTTPLPSTPNQAPLGPMDMTVERRPLTTGVGFQEYLYVVIDHRPSGGPIHIRAIDATAGGVLAPALNTTITQSPFLVGQRLSLAFDPTGNAPNGPPGGGTFWISGPTAGGGWAAFEFNRAGNIVLNTLGQPVSFNTPPQTAGMDYDETLGNFYCFSSNPVATPSGVTIHCNGTEISAFTGLPTGVRFCGDLALQVPGSPPGGFATAMSLYRTAGPRSELRFLCLSDHGPTEQHLYVLAGPFRYGYSRYGTIGMQNGPPFLGGAIDITLEGVPNSLFGMMFLGNSVSNIPLGPGIQAEAVASLVPLVSAALMPVMPVGRFSTNIQLPNTPALAYASAFFQYVVLDTTAPGFVGFSQAGKTVIYP